MANYCFLSEIFPPTEKLYVHSSVISVVVNLTKSITIIR